MKNIAVVTGASSGMGRMFALTIKDNVEVDEIWAFALDEEGLLSLQKESPIPVKIFPADLTKEDIFIKYKEELRTNPACIKLLINAAGYGIFDSVRNTSYENNSGMVELNALALIKMTSLSLPYMNAGSKIINFASMAAFQPIPYISIYAATKSFVLSFSRSLKRELKNIGIDVMAVTPYWTKTKFFDRAVTKNNVVKKYEVMYESADVIAKAWRDLKKKKDYSAYGFKTNFNIIMGKILPHKVVMNIWMNQQKLK